jgi:tyrosine-protein phosphatase SIW14
MIWNIFRDITKECGSFMNTVLKRTICSLGFLFTISGNASAQTHEALSTSHTVGDIANFHRVIKSEIYRSGQVQKDEYQLLKEFGIKTVISLNDYGVAGFTAEDEQEWAHSAGINFIHREMHPWNKPSLKQIQDVLELLTTVEKPVLIHCQGGSDRTGVSIGAYRMVYENWSYDSTYAEMLYYGFNRVEYGWQDQLQRLP